MDIRIFVLVVFVGVIGSFAEARAGFFTYSRNGEERKASPPIMEYAASRSKREVGDSNGETANSSETKPTTTPATTTTTSSSTTDPTTTDPTTTDPTTTEPTTTDPTTTDPTSPTTPTTKPSTTPTTDPTTPTTTIPSTTPTTPATTSPTDATPEETKPTKKPTDDFPSRSNFDEPESKDSPKKPGPSSKEGMPTPGPYNPYGPFGPYFGPGFGTGFDPYFGYPGPNFIPGSGPNYGWPSANSGSGFASAGASAGTSAGSFAGGYTGMGYPTAGFPAVGSTNIGSRGGFQDNSPDQTGYNPSGIDPLYNAGPGFYFPGQYPTYNDPTFDMFRQIQAQIEAQHQALANSMASQQSPMANQGRTWNMPNYPFPYSSGNTNSVGRYPTVGGSYIPGAGNSNMEFHNRLASEAANYGGTPQVASASIGLGPNGGFQAGQISPALPGIESRFAEDLSPPSGNSFGVFASSSSSSRTGPDGKQINHKSSITGVNDNGKITYRTVHD